MHRIRFVLFIAFLLPLAAAAQDDEALYQNFGFNISGHFAQPQTAVFKGFKDRFDAETAFPHQPMELGTLSNGGGLGIIYFAGNAYVDFEYRALGLKSSFVLQPKVRDPEQAYQFRLYQHSGRFSYNYGRSFGKYGTSGIYLGAAVYAGTWGLKLKEPDRKMQKMSIDDYSGFGFGVSPQLTFRVYILEVKAFYDYPLMKTDLTPVYNKLFEGYGAPDAGGDSRLKNRIGHAGISVSLFIPFGKPSQIHSAESRTSRSSATPVPYAPAQKSEREKSQERIEEMNRQQERQERRWNEKWNR